MNELLKPLKEPRNMWRNQMSDLKFVMLANIIVKLGYCICVTVAAIYFNSPSLLWWYLLAYVMGWRYTSKGAVDKDD
jgi:hypothetical protein